MMRNLLVLGKDPHADYRRRKLIALARTNGFDDAREYDYHEIPEIQRFKGDTVNVMFFFPTAFWDENCEVPADTGLYGTSKRSYDLFRNYFAEVGEALRDRFRGQTLNFAITPENATADRDKIETVRALQRAGIPTPDQIVPRSAAEAIDAVTEDRGVFVKARYGAQGKGITVLRNGKWVTNYRVEGHHLGNYGVDDKWPFTDITGRWDLLSQLMEHEVIVELEVLRPPFLGDTKFDVRAYTVNFEAPHFFLRVNPASAEITNYVQGANVVNDPQTGLSEDARARIIARTKQTARALNMRFGGIDIMFHQDLDHDVVVEVQAFTGYSAPKHFDLIKHMLKPETGLFV